VVAFLVINQIAELPITSIRSVLINSDSNIRVGYLNDQDIDGLALSPRIEFIKLNPLPNFELKGGYKDFSESLFYQIVQLKWQLLETLLDSDFEVIVYSDLDVIWLSNPITSLGSVFMQDSNVQVQIQSFTSDPSDPKLCMGFVAFRNSSATREIVAACKKIHVQSLEKNSKFGDDDAVTKFYIENKMTSKIFLLPQSTFPVGSLLNLHSTRPVYPGLAAPKPFIFHLNYVVGLQNKRIMLRLLNRRFDFEISGLNHWILLLYMKKLRIIFSKIKRKLFF
jgi:hypothetical protein